MPTKKTRALIPISVDNPAFSTRTMVAALSAIPARYEEYIFFIADDLQLYNKAVTVQEGSELVNVLKTFNERAAYFTEKTNWLTNVRNKLNNDIANSTWTFSNIATYSDERLHDILRNVFILYSTVPKFSRDVEEAARNYVTRTEKSYSSKEVELSTFYILEEIAVNLRIRVEGHIDEEYYLFNYPKPMIDVYAGCYGISPFTLVGLRDEDEEFAFYRFVSERDSYWTRVLPSNAG